MPLPPRGPLNTYAQLLEAKLQLVDARIVVKVGPSWIRAQLPPPRVVLLPASEQFSAGDGRQGAGSPAGARKVLNNRTVQTQLHLWAAALNDDGTVDGITDDLHVDAMEVLIDQVVIAMRQLRWNEAITEPRTGTWVQADSQVLSHGVGYILLTDLQIPVTMAVPTAVVQTYPTTGKIVPPT